MITSTIGTAVLLTLSLYLWRILLPTTDWAALALFPLAALLFMGSFRSSSAVFRASLKAAVREDSSLAWLMTGRVRACLGATLFSFIAVQVLAWHAISSTYPELIFLAFLCFFASFAFLAIEQRLLDHLTPPFARSTALWAGTVVAAVLFIPILAWANWNFTPQPKEILTVGLEEALHLGFSQLPARRGFLAEMLAPLYALEYAKLWFVVQTESPKWLSYWFSIDAALVSLFVARASAVLVSLIEVRK